MPVTVVVAMYCRHCAFGATFSKIYVSDPDVLYQMANKLLTGSRPTNEHRIDDDDDITKLYKNLCTGRLFSRTGYEIT